MTLDLVFVGAAAGRAALAQFTAESGVPVALVAERTTTMEIFPVSVLTVALDAPVGRAQDAAGWFTRRGIHRLAA